MKRTNLIAASVMAAAFSTTSLAGGGHSGNMPMQQGQMMQGGQMPMQKGQVMDHGNMPMNQGQMMQGGQMPMNPGNQPR